MHFFLEKNLCCLCIHVCRRLRCHKMLQLCVGSLVCKCFIVNHVCIVPPYFFMLMPMLCTPTHAQAHAQMSKTEESINSILFLMNMMRSKQMGISRREIFKFSHRKRLLLFLKTVVFSLKLFFVSQRNSFWFLSKKLLCAFTEI